MTKRQSSPEKGSEPIKPAPIQPPRQEGESIWQKTSIDLDGRTVDVHFGRLRKALVRAYEPDDQDDLYVVLGSAAESISREELLNAPEMANVSLDFWGGAPPRESNDILQNAAETIDEITALTDQTIAAVEDTIQHIRYARSRLSARKSEPSVEAEPTRGT